MKEQHLERMNRKIVSVSHIKSEDAMAETRYWRSRPPVERLIALELLRMRITGYDNTQSRLQRVFTVTQRT